MFSPDGTLISASAAPHCGVRERRGVVVEEEGEGGGNKTEKGGGGGLEERHGVTDIYIE